MEELVDNGELPAKRRKMGRTGISVGEYVIDATDPASRAEIIEALRQADAPPPPPQELPPSRSPWLLGFAIGLVVALVLGIVLLSFALVSGLENHRAKLAPATPDRPPPAEQVTPE